jgi:hypothetical protein
MKVEGQSLREFADLSRHRMQQYFWAVAPEECVLG